MTRQMEEPRVLAHVCCTRRMLYLILLGWLLAEAPAQQAAAPMIVCDDKVYDFGTLLSGMVLRHTFQIQNGGVQPLDIAQVTGCCGMSVTSTNSFLAPGESATITARLPLKGLSGKISKTVTILSNDPHQPICHLTVTGTVIAPYEMEPLGVNFFQVSTHSQVERTISVRPNLEFHIQDIASTLPGVEGVWTKSTNSFFVTIRTKPPLRRGLSSGKVEIRTDNHLFPTIEIPVYLDVRSDFITIPSEILVVARSGRQSPLAYTSTIRSRSQAPFQILQVSPPEPGIKVRLIPRCYQWSLNAEATGVCRRRNRAW